MSGISTSVQILLVDDDPQGLDSNRKILELAGYDVIVTRDGQEALELVRPSADGTPPRVFDVIVTDVRMPRLGGLEFLKAYSVCGQETPVVLMTAYGTVEDAVWAMKLGAVDFLSKPFKRQALLSAVENALARSRVRASGAASSSAADGFSAARGAGTDLIGDSQAMRSLKAQIAQVAPTTVTILLTGESGTGKELVARRIHEGSPRAGARFVALNCAAVPENLIESELFGHEKGAFTGASQSKPGLFEIAHGGTILLDEIGDMPLSAQVKLLRVLQESEVRRVGATASRKVDVRVLAATHRDLREGVASGRFREDLLFRLEVIHLTVPPLRERMEDVAALARHFLEIASRRHGKPVDRISAEATKVLLAHAWPGNIRELSNVIERSVVFATDGQIQLTDLPPHLLDLAARSQAPTAGAQNSLISFKLGTPLKDVEDLLIRRTLEATAGDKNMAAKLLGINSRTIYRKLEPEKRGAGERTEERPDVSPGTAPEVAHFQPEPEPS